MRKPLKVLLVIPDLFSGGAERFVVDLAKHIDKTRFDIEICCFSDAQHTPLEKELKMADIKLFNLGKEKGFDFRIYLKLHSLFSYLSPDVIHTHLYVLKYTFPIAQVNKIAIQIHTIHSQPSREVGKMDRLVHKLVFKNGVIPVSISQRNHEEFNLVYGNIWSPVIYNGVDIVKFKDANYLNEENLTERLSLEGKFVMLCVAYFRGQKNHHLLLSAFRCFHEIHPNSVLLLAGDGPLMDNCQEYSSFLKIDPYVHFLGNRKDISNLMHISDIFILASTCEGLPISILEAMAAGKPVIATNVGGVSELVESGVTGILVPPENEKALVDSIEQLFIKKEQRIMMGLNAQKKVNSFNIKRCVCNYEKLYEQTFENNLLKLKNKC